MVDGLTTTIEIASLALAVWCLVSTVRDQPMVVPHLVAIAVLELLLIGQAVVSTVLMVGGERPAETITFVGYLATVVLIPPACAVWGFMERSRWGPAVIAFACLILPVMMVRLEQIWDPSVL
ncbi:hypothetical protein [Marinitenerispora sediminis]|uniref:Integral membrane protein n=1 Tax=Marinitenerispora sediminis TaxID=1931232 RepID=A0A368T980_9ACTN|nr:hypothetical protein [Marinitenerispora sediminis]RCV54779.1 hypothetical protein DEF28_07490 [Marinitenerispora sediminis]RCV60545.1 hypothetical protein DEF23_04275 [Marinitenerispora sediminis]RCV61011.1 hypothetical protein DEF24_05175 [Marinitenerispora sediminis]